MKAERWAKKQKFPISFLALGLIEYLKKVWTNTKIKNEMASVDAQIKKLHEEWDEEEKKQFAPEIIETPSEVEGLNDMSIGHFYYFSAVTFLSFIIWALPFLTFLFLLFHFSSTPISSFHISLEFDLMFVLFSSFLFLTSFV